MFRVKYPTEEKLCLKCRESKPLSEFRDVIRKGIVYKSSPCRSCLAERQLAYTRENKDRINARNKSWRLRNPDKWNASMLKARIKFKDRYTRYWKEFTKRYRKTPRGKIELAVRCRLYYAFKSQKLRKSRKTFDLTGCSVQDLMIYLESKFEPGMSWDNYGKGPGTWQIDHIIPCALFDLSKPDHQKACFHFSNLQPLWSVDNLKKGKHCQHA